MSENRLHTIGYLTMIMAYVVITLHHLSKHIEDLHRFMENNPWIKGLIPLLLQVSLVTLLPIAMFLYLKNRKIIATGLAVLIFPIVVTSILIGDTVVTVGILLVLGLGCTSYWVWTRRPWWWRRINWNPPKVEDIRSEIRRRKHAGNLTRSEADSLQTAIDGIDGSDLEILRLLDQSEFMVSIRRSPSATHSFGNLAKELSQKFPDLGGEKACEGRLRRLEQNGLIRKEETWPETSRYTTSLGQRVVRIVQETNK